LQGQWQRGFLAGFGAEILRIDPPFWNEPSTGIFYHSNTLIYLSFLVFYQQYYQLKEIVRLALGY
jgi:hypothetical protein